MLVWLGHLAHGQGDLTIELEAYQSRRLVPSKVDDLKGKVEELEKQVKCLKRDLDWHKEMLAKVACHMALMQNAHANQDEMCTKRDLLVAEKVKFRAEKF